MNFTTPFWGVKFKKIRKMLIPKFTNSNMNGNLLPTAKIQEALDNLGVKIQNFAQDYGKLPAIIRSLVSFDPTGIIGAIDKYLSEKTSEEERKFIISSLQELSDRLSIFEADRIPELQDDKLRFMYQVYVLSKGNSFSKVNPDELKDLLGLHLDRVMSIGEFLENHDLLNFPTWVNGIKMTPKGIIRVEFELLHSQNELPVYVNQEEINKIIERNEERMKVLKYLFKMSGGNTYTKVFHEEISKDLNIDHNYILTGILPILAYEDWVIWSTADCVRISEEGCDLVKSILALE